LLRKQQLFPALGRFFIHQHISAVHLALTKNKKGEILGKLQGIAKESGSVVFLNFHGLTMPDLSEIRKTLRGKDLGYTVAKKTLTRKAFEGFTGSMPELPGELAIVSGKDLIEPAREIYQFQKKLDKKLSIVGGVFEGRYMSQSEMLTVAQIPGLKTLHAQFVNLINSPIQGFVMALDQIAKSKTA
jgi:large subunit ribosomal protein L10